MESNLLHTASKVYTNRWTKLYIKADDIEEKFDFMSYVSPLRTISWITLMILSGLMSLFMFLLIKTLNKEAFSIVSS